MKDRPTSFLYGGCGCLAAAIVGGFALALLGGHFHMDPGGAFLVFIAGGVLGLVVRGIYGRGVEAGRGPAPPEPDPVLPEGYGGVNTPPLRPFARPWGPNLPPTVEEALVQAAVSLGNSQIRSLHETPEETRLVLRAPREGVESTVTIIASNETDSLRVEIDDDLGQLVAPTSSWRGAAEDGEGFIRAMDFVKAYLVDSFAHVVTGGGEHRLVEALEVPGMVSADEGLRVRSWLGTLDREPSETS